MVRHLDHHAVRYVPGDVTGVDPGGERPEGGDHPTDPLTGRGGQLDVVAVAVAILEQDVQPGDVVLHRVLGAERQDQSDEPGAADHQTDIDVQLVQRHHDDGHPHDGADDAGQRGDRRVDTVLTA